MVAMELNYQNALKILQSGIPWLEITLDFDYSSMLIEAHALYDLFVGHRFSNGKGWKSLCIHGISPTHTMSANNYGYADEMQAPHTWTEVAEACPITTAFLK